MPSKVSESRNYLFANAFLLYTAEFFKNSEKMVSLGSPTNILQAVAEDICESTENFFVIVKKILNIGQQLIPTPFRAKCNANRLNALNGVEALLGVIISELIDEHSNRVEACFFSGHFE